MINKDLFYALTGQSRDIYMKPAPRLIAHPKAISNIFIAEGHASEFYSIDGKSRIYSWFWGKGEYVIPTSGYSNLVLSDKATYIQMNYSGAISILRKHPESRILYSKLREEHDKEIAERIREIKTFTPLEQYISLITKKPWVLEKVPPADIASFLRISESEMKKFSTMTA